MALHSIFRRLSRNARRLSRENPPLFLLDEFALRMENTANAHSRHKNRYGRTPHYVFLQDSNLLNAEIIKGSGPCIYGLPFGRTGEFRRLDLKR